MYRSLRQSWSFFKYGKLVQVPWRKRKGTVKRREEERKDCVRDEGKEEERKEKRGAGEEVAAVWAWRAEFGSQHPCEGWHGRVARAYNPSAGNVETGGSLGLARQSAELLSFKLCGRPKVGNNWRRHPTLTSVFTRARRHAYQPAHTHTHTCIHIHHTKKGTVKEGI